MQVHSTFFSMAKVSFHSHHVDDESVCYFFCLRNMGWRACVCARKCVNISVRMCASVRGGFYTATTDNLNFPLHSVCVASKFNFRWINLLSLVERSLHKTTRVVTLIRTNFMRSTQQKLVMETFSAKKRNQDFERTNPCACFWRWAPKTQPRSFMHDLFQLTTTAACSSVTDRENHLHCTICWSPPAQFLMDSISWQVFFFATKVVQKFSAGSTSVVPWNRNKLHQLTDFVFSSWIGFEDIFAHQRSDPRGAPVTHLTIWKNFCYNFVNSFDKFMFLKQCEKWRVLIDVTFVNFLLPDDRLSEVPFLLKLFSNICNHNYSMVLFFKKLPFLWIIQKEIWASPCY